MLEKYQVIISGRTLDGAPLSSVKAEVGKAFRLKDEQLDRMLSGKPRIVARSVTAGDAEKLVARLHALDLEAHARLLDENRDEAPPPSPSSTGIPPAPPKADSEPHSPESQELFALVAPGSSAHGSAAAPLAMEEIPADGVICPKCGESQPKRTLCRACGLDMPRYRAMQEAEEREQQEARAAELAARRAGAVPSPRRGEDDRPALLSLSFNGRLGRLDYLAASLFSTLIWTILVWLAVATGKNAFAGLGMILSSVYALRYIALRLHDTGRTGWLALVVIVPLAGALMALALLFIDGDEDSNEYGPANTGSGGGRALVTLVTFFVISGVFYAYVNKSPERLMRFAQATSMGQGSSAFDDDEMDEMSFDDEPVRYARNNRIDIYVVPICNDCDAMLAWLHGNGLRPSVYYVDRDQEAAERLNSITGNGSVMLPVLEVNGIVLPGNPGIDKVHALLRQESR